MFMKRFSKTKGLYARMRKRNLSRTLFGLIPFYSVFHFESMYKKRKRRTPRVCAANVVVRSCVDVVAGWDLQAVFEFPHFDPSSPPPEGSALTLIVQNVYDTAPFLSQGCHFSVKAA